MSKSEQLVHAVMNWFHTHILPNPSGQNQLLDHTCPAALYTFILLSIPYVGFYLGFLMILKSIHKELYVDGHYQDFFKNTEAGQDGRVDLFFRILGSLIAYLTLFWSI